MIRRFLTRILLVILIGVCGYNAWQITQLQAEIARMRTETHGHRSAKAGDPTVPDTVPSGGWLEDADRHAARAREAVAHAEFSTARRELERGSDDIHRALSGPEAKTQATVEQARRSLAILQSQADILWQKLHAARPASLR